VGDFEEAADGLEAFARSSPSAATPPRAIEDALALRLALRQGDKASKDADLFVARYAKAEPVGASRASLAVADYDVDRGSPANGRTRLNAWQATFGDAAPLDARIHAQTLIGRANVRLNEKSRADAAYARVLELWKDPEAAQRTLAAEGADGRLGVVLSDLGEALFSAAELRRKEADKIRFPEYRGNGTREDILQHMNTKVVQWVRAKRPAIEAAEREYKKIVDLQPAPPPKWVVRSATGVGRAWAKFVAEFRAAPIPAAWKGHGSVPGTSTTYDQLRAEYYRMLDEASEPQKQVARAAFKVCVDYSTKYAYADDFSLACHEWLEKNYPAEFHAPSP
jgi:hypothetical protein